MTKNVIKITDGYKHMCGWKICVIICSMQASLNRYWFNHINILREQVRSKGGRIVCLGVDATEKSNSYNNGVYPNNQHIHLKPRYALLAIQCNPVDGFSVPHFLFDNTICAKSIV